MIEPRTIPPGLPLVSRSEQARLLWAQRAARRKVRASGKFLLDREVKKIDAQK